MQQIKGSRLTYTEVPAISNSSSNATASFPNVRPTVTYDPRGSAVPASSSVGVFTGGVKKLTMSEWVLGFVVVALGWNVLM